MESHCLSKIVVNFVIPSITTTALSTVFFATRGRGSGKDDFAVAFPLISKGLVLLLVLGTVRPLHSNQRWVPLPVPLTIYSVFSTMIPRANSPPGRRALRLDPQRGGALIQPDGPAGPRNDSSYPAYEPVPNASSSSSAFRTAQPYNYHDWLLLSRASLSLRPTQVSGLRSRRGYEINRSGRRSRARSGGTCSGCWAACETLTKAGPSTRGRLCLPLGRDDRAVLGIDLFETNATVIVLKAA